MKKKKKGEFCLKCGSTENITQHHILPKRFFGDTRNKITLCLYCHQGKDGLESIIPLREELPPVEYFQIVLDFLNNW